MRRDPSARFWSKVDRSGSCRIWQGSVGQQHFGGHGQFWLDGRVVKAHRFAYELLVGPIPEGLTLDHLCRNPACVNPDHLEPVTLSENILRGVGTGAINARKTHCKHGHEYTPENTNLKADGSRQCRTCSAAWARARYRRKRLDASN